jgi:nucleotide-binding universal stress UspA family protein
VPDPVLVTIDFSEYSESVAAWAVDYARAQGSPLVILHVAHDPVQTSGYEKREGEPGSASSLPEWQTIEELAEAEMNSFLARARERISGFSELDSVEARIVVGVPTTRILEVAEEIGASLIVMGSQGRTGLSHLLIGSKAEQVVRLSPIPVTIVKMPRAGKETGE